ncbi:MAG: DUF748 domain-containing protein [Candidatus Omnitrophota bacterium]
MKKLGIIILVFLAIFVGIVYYFRYDILNLFRQSAETIIKKSLPEYVTVDRIIFDLGNNLLEVKDLGIKNPRGYSDKYLATIGSITCRYRKKGKNILDGIKVTEIAARYPRINVERLEDGRFNVNEMDEVMEPGKQAKTARKEGTRKEAVKKEGEGRVFGKKISDYIELTDTINIEKGEVMFLDRAVYPSPYKLMFDNVNGSIVLDLTDDYSDVKSMSSSGTGFVNSDRFQRMSWNVSLDPRTERLTMSNRYEVSNVNILLFRPYYDRYSPIDIERGRFSGTLVFDFNNGNIGSMNTLRLSDLKFKVKQDASGAGFWEASIPDIIEYLRTSRGDIVFDFKIKGDMNSPRFYPGPHLKQAIQMKVVDTIADVLAPQEEGQPGAPKSDAEQVVDVLRELMKK